MSIGKRDKVNYIGEKKYMYIYIYIYQNTQGLVRQI